MNRAERRRLLRDSGPGIVVSWISPGLVHHRFTDSLMASMLYDANEGGHRILVGGGFASMMSSPRIAEARCQMVENFLHTEAFAEAEWWVTIDADMVWEQPTIHRMIERAEANDISVIGGLCFAGGFTGPYPTAYNVIGTLDDGLPEVARVDLMEIADAVSSDSPPLVKVDGTGAAFLAVRRRVLYEMGQAFMVQPDGKVNPYPWFAELVGDGSTFGEDVAFCLKARQLGYEVCLDTASKIGHIKDRVIDWNLYQETSR